MGREEDGEGDDAGESEHRSGMEGRRGSQVGREDGEGEPTAAETAKCMQLVYSLADFSAELEHEVSLGPSDVVLVCEKNENGWWQGAVVWKGDEDKVRLATCDAETPGLGGFVDAVRVLFFCTCSGPLLILHLHPCSLRISHWISATLTIGSVVCPQTLSLPQPVLVLVPPPWPAIAVPSSSRKLLFQTSPSVSSGGMLVRYSVQASQMMIPIVSHGLKLPGSHTQNLNPKPARRA